MERTMSVEDKIRRAEEIYYRRRKQEIPNIIEKEPIKREKKDIKLFKKMFKQIVICLTIYGCFYLVVNNNYIFSEDFTNKTKEILSKDINFVQLYSIISTKVNDYMQTLNQVNPAEDSKEQTPQEQTNSENIQNNEENIGGAEEELTEQNGDNNIINESVLETEEDITGEVQLSQMEQDAKYIKETVSFVKPVNGVISSAFGARNPTTATVPKNHTGTDIAANTGTKIVSATDGTVILTSSKGDYGKHLKIQINEIIMVYAHCKKLYVKEGDTVSQGQEIAEVGATGNVTGPHLHFEIRFQNRYVNPQMILEL